MAPRSQAQKAHLASIIAKRVAAAAAEPDPEVKVLECKLKSVQTQLASTKDHLDTTQSQLYAAKEKYTNFYGSTRVERESTRGHMSGKASWRLRSRFYKVLARFLKKMLPRLLHCWTV
jgi:hypothetical protein